MESTPIQVSRNVQMNKGSYVTFICSALHSNVSQIHLSFKTVSQPFNYIMNIVFLFALSMLVERCKSKNISNDYLNNCLRHHLKPIQLYCEDQIKYIVSSKIRRTVLDLGSEWPFTQIIFFLITCNFYTTWTVTTTIIIIITVIGYYYEPASFRLYHSMLNFIN